MHWFLDRFYFICIHIFPFWRADITASASLQGIRSEGPRLHALCLASAAISTRELIKPSLIIFMKGLLMIRAISGRSVRRKGSPPDMRTMSIFGSC